MIFPFDDGDTPVAFNFGNDDYAYHAGFGIGTETVAQDGDMADMESNADGEFEIDDDHSAWQFRNPNSTNHESPSSTGNTREDGRQSSANNYTGGDSESQSSDQVLNQYKRTRMSGDAFAQQRPITADLDSTDEMIVNMKNCGYSNEQVCTALVKDGRVHYDKKTVGTRYLRIKSAIADREEARLDDELTDWHEGEDEALLKADQLALAEIDDAIEKAKGKRWQLVARNLQKILSKDYKYSPSSCRKRFVALKNDMASIPPELDDDPVRRGEEKAARALERLRERQIRESTVLRAKENVRLGRDQEKLRKALEKKRRADDRLRVAEEKAHVAQEQAAKRDQKAKELETERKTQEAQILLLREETRPPYGYLPEPFMQKMPSIYPLTPASSISTPSTGKSRSSKTGTKIKAIGVAVDDPRTKMTVVELGGLCVARGLKKHGNKATLMKRISDHDSKLAVNGLQALLRAKAASIDGSKQELVVRLAQADASNSAWGRRHSVALSLSVARTSPDASVVDQNEDPPMFSGKRGISENSNCPEPKRVRLGEGGSSSPVLLALATAAAEAVESHMSNWDRPRGSQMSAVAPVPASKVAHAVDTDINV